MQTHKKQCVLQLCYEKIVVRLTFRTTVLNITQRKTQCRQIVGFLRSIKVFLSDDVSSL